MPDTPRGVSGEIASAERGILRAAPVSQAILIACDWTRPENLVFRKRVIDRQLCNLWLLSVREWNKKAKGGVVDHDIMDSFIS